MAEHVQKPTTIEAAIDLFLESQARHGLAPPADPITEEDHAAVVEAIAPMRLPAEVVILWRAFQREDGALAAGYELWPAKAALEQWQFDIDSGLGIWPVCLFPIACESHEFRWIELDGPSDLDGGRIWRGNYEDSEIAAVAPTLADLVASVASGWDAGLFGGVSRGNGRSLIEDHDGWSALLSARFGPPEVIDCWDRHGWPARWRLLSGLEERDLYPADIVTPISQLRGSEAWLHSGSVVIAGKVSVLLGMGLGSRVLVDDGTAQIEVWVSVGKDPFADVRSGAHLQIELVRGTGSPKASDIEYAHTAVVEALGRGAITDAQSLAVGLVPSLEPSQAEAVAISVRRVDRRVR